MNTIGDVVIRGCLISKRNRIDGSFSLGTPRSWSEKYKFKDKVQRADTAAKQMSSRIKTVVNIDIISVVQIQYVHMTTRNPTTTSSIP